MVCLCTKKVNKLRSFSSLQLNGISPSQGFAIEFLLTLQLVLCVLAVTDKRRDISGFAPLAIGLSVGLGHLAGVSTSHNIPLFPLLINLVDVFSILPWPDTIDLRRMIWL